MGIKPFLRSVLLVDLLLTSTVQTAAIQNSRKVLPVDHYYFIQFSCSYPFNNKLVPSYEDGVVTRQANKPNGKPEQKKIKITKKKQQQQQRASNKALVDEALTCLIREISFFHRTAPYEGTVVVRRQCFRFLTSSIRNYTATTSPVVLVLLVVYL